MLRAVLKARHAAVVVDGNAFATILCFDQLARPCLAICGLTARLISVARNIVDVRLLDQCRTILAGAQKSCKYKAVATCSCQPLFMVQHLLSCQPNYRETSSAACFNLGCREESLHQVASPTYCNSWVHYIRGGTLCRAEVKLNGNTFSIETRWVESFEVLPPLLA